MFSKTQLTILNMLSLSLIGKAKEMILEETRAFELISECNEQGVLSLVSDYILPLCQDDDEKNTLFYRCVRHVCITQGILAVQKELLEVLYANGFHPVILKGWAAAQYYPSPDKRTFGDIDVLFSREEFYSAVELLMANGFTCRDKETKLDHHIPLVKDNIVVEPHIAVAGLPKGESAKEYLEKLFDDGLRNPIMKSICGYEVPFFPELQNGLVLLLHIRGHLKGGLGLRQIADWMAFVRLYLDDDAYNAKWKEILDKTGLDKLAKVSTALCIKYLNLEGNYTWCKDADDKTIDKMMTFIFEQGNFGHKQRNADIGAKSISRTGGIVGFNKQLYDSGVFHWSMRNKSINTETRPILRALAWFYGLGHYFNKLHKKGGLPYLIKSYSEAKERRKFFSSLGLYD